MTKVPLPGHAIREGISHKGRATTVVNAYDLGCDDEENRIPLAALLDELNAVMEKIPAENRDSAYLYVTAYGEYASASADVRWERPETDSEFSARIRWLDSLDEESEERDRREFERLRRKYEAVGD